MAKITLAELKKRAPNLPDAELKKDLRAINRLQKLQDQWRRKAQTPKAVRERKRQWLSYVEAELAHMKDGYDAGDESVLWDAILFCEQTETPKPGWLKEALEKYGRARINGVPIKKKMGRPMNHHMDLRIFGAVDFWREQKIIFGRKGRVRRFSYDRAFAKVRRELQDDGYNLSAGAIRAAYRRGKKIMEHPENHYLSPFQDSR